MRLLKVVAEKSKRHKPTEEDMGSEEEVEPKPAEVKLVDVPSGGDPALMPDVADGVIEDALFDGLDLGEQD